MDMFGSIEFYDTEMNKLFERPSGSLKATSEYPTFRPEPTKCGSCLTSHTTRNGMRTRMIPWPRARLPSRSGRPPVTSSSSLAQAACGVVHRSGERRDRLPDHGLADHSHARSVP